LYALLKPPVRFLISLFYRRIRVFGAENLPESGAVIIISNHQNALLDPVISCVLLRRQIHWLTRADVFRKPIANKILRSLNMMPVYRAHDKADLRTANDPTFQECTSLLKSGSIIGLFPEGTHHGGKYLKPLKKGLARIALASLQELPETQIYLVPVGLDYENSFHSGFDLCLSIGKPIDLSDFRGQNPADNSSLQRFTQLANSILSREMIDLQNPEIAEHFKVLEDVIADVWDETNGENRGAYSAFHSLRKAVFSPLENQDVNLWKTTADKWLAFQIKYKFKYQRGSMLSRSTIIGFLIEITYFIFLPLHFSFYPVRLVTRTIVSQLIKDIHFTSSIKILIAPVVSLLAIFSYSLALVIATSTMIIAGIFPVLALVYLIVWPDLVRKRRLFKTHRMLNRLKNNHESLMEWLIIREQISNLLVKTQ
jgi:1-acyl-sn-glycerol-3-phosphate acyltransferase